MYTPHYIYCNSHCMLGDFKAHKDIDNVLYNMVVPFTMMAPLTWMLTQYNRYKNTGVTHHTRYI